MSSTRRGLFLALTGAAAIVASQAQAQSAFCAGFEAGWKAAFENRNKLPALTPLCPLPRAGGDTFQHGYERGMMAALAHIQQRGY
jgi:hypothetical protein